MGVTLFFMFLLNMLYYAQLFNFKNFNKPLYTLLTPDVLKSWYTDYSQWGSSYNTYQLTLTVVNIIIFVMLGIIIFNDYFLIINIL